MPSENDALREQWLALMAAAPIVDYSVDRSSLLASESCWRSKQTIGRSFDAVWAKSRKPPPAALNLETGLLALELLCPPPHIGTIIGSGS